MGRLGKKSGREIGRQQGPEPRMSDVGKYSLDRSEIRGEIGPPRSQIWTKAAQALAPICFATFTTTTGLWTIHADAWARIVRAYPALTIPMDTVVAEANRRQ